ncbi:MAG: hypothetical protein ABUL47_04075 [Leifsonia sp.]
MTDTVARRPRRPWELTVVVVLCYLQAVLEVVTGIVLIFTRYLPDFSDEVFGVTVLGASTVVLGLLIAAVASGIARGDRFARVALTVLLAIDIVTDAVLALVEHDDIATRVVSIVVDAVMLGVLWGIPRARRWFAPRAS